MVKCSFCSEELEQGTGKMYVRNDGKIFYFCGSKCDNNFHMGRVPGRQKWISKKKKA